MRKALNDLKSDIATLFADNTVGDITPIDLRTFLVDYIDSISPAYGAMGITSLARTLHQTFSEMDWETQIAATLPEFTCNTSTGKITRNDPKTTNRIEFNMDIEAANNTTIYAALYVNGVITPFTTSCTGRGANNPVVMNFTGLHYSDGPAVYDVRVKAEVNNSAVTFLNGVFIVEAVPVRSYV
jgi:hypothetical protein